MTAIPINMYIKYQKCKFYTSLPKYDYGWDFEFYCLGKTDSFYLVFANFRSLESLPLANLLVVLALFSRFALYQSSSWINFLIIFNDFTSCWSLSLFGSYTRIYRLIEPFFSCFIIVCRCIIWLSKLALILTHDVGSLRVSFTDPSKPIISIKPQGFDA